MYTRSCNCPYFSSVSWRRIEKLSTTPRILISTVDGNDNWTSRPFTSRGTALLPIGKESGWASQSVLDVITHVPKSKPAPPASHCWQSNIAGGAVNQLLSRTFRKPRTLCRYLRPGWFRVRCASRKLFAIKCHEVVDFYVSCNSIWPL